jgi:elongation factor Ts
LSTLSSKRTFNKEPNVEIAATEVKKLRDKTGAGMMDCKRALQEAQGDSARALKILKELGLAAAAKRAGRATNEGRVFTALSPSVACCVEVSCETDFVAKNSDFKALGATLADYVIKNKPAAITKEMEEAVAGTIGKIKENITIRRFKAMEANANEFFTEYVHGEGKIGVVVKMSAEKKELMQIQAVKELAFNLALHIAAFAPRFVSEDKISPDFRQEQEEIALKQAQQLGKPENVTKGIAQGKVKKVFAEVCLQDQGFVKDEKILVRKVIEETGKVAGGKLAVTDFLYFRMGEELE